MGASSAKWCKSQKSTGGLQTIRSSGEKQCKMLIIKNATIIVHHLDSKIFLTFKREEKLHPFWSQRSCVQSNAAIFWHKVIITLLEPTLTGCVTCTHPWQAHNYADYFKYMLICNKNKQYALYADHSLFYAVNYRLPRASNHQNSTDISKPDTHTINTVMRAFAAVYVVLNPLSRCQVNHFACGVCAVHGILMFEFKGICVCFCTINNFRFCIGSPQCKIWALN